VIADNDMDGLRSMVDKYLRRRTMKYMYLFVSLLLTFISCKKVGSIDSTSNKLKDSISMSDSTIINDYSDYTFKDEKERADTLTKNFQLAKTNKDKAYCERIIFRSFPNTFDGMMRLFGYDDVTLAAPLYSIPFEDNLITYFGSLQTIPKDTYYNKYISICVNGYWDADNIREAFGFGKRLSEDTKDVCRVLFKKTDKEILSVFRFIFDGPHPKNDENALIYDDLSTKLKKQDSRLFGLLKTAYNKLLQEDDGHGE